MIIQERKIFWAEKDFSTKQTLLIRAKNYDYGTDDDTKATYCVWTSFACNEDKLAINFNLKSLSLFAFLFNFEKSEFD